MREPAVDDGKKLRGADHRPLAVLIGKDHPHARTAGQRDSQASHEAVRVCYPESA